MIDATSLSASPLADAIQGAAEGETILCRSEDQAFLVARGARRLGKRLLVELQDDVICLDSPDGAA